LLIDQHIKSNTIANGRPAIMEAVWRAMSPPLTTNVAATTPSNIAQNNLCILGGFGLPPEVIMSITIEPESEDVTKRIQLQTVL